MSDHIKVALAGNPNSGKTTIFNELTGSRQHVGNYPGVTVEKKSGFRVYEGKRIEFIDLPGIYSLTAFSVEELIARDFILKEKPDVIVNVVDSSNIERNLYLSIQLLELNVPVVFALNMADLVANEGIKFDSELLSQLLRSPAVKTIGYSGEGIDNLLHAIHECSLSPISSGSIQIPYGKDIENEILSIEEVIKKSEDFVNGDYSTRWLAVKLLEDDQQITKMFSRNGVVEVLNKSRSVLEEKLEQPLEVLLADRRYGFISGLVKETVEKPLVDRRSFSDKVDSILTNRLLGLPLFFFLMYMVFQITFTVGDPMMGWIEGFFGWAGDTVSGFWPENSESPLRSLLVDGIIGGVGGVLVFLPNIVLLFLAISFLEDTGYMARAAFIMDRVMHKIGLHGKSFIPMLIGFGCSVPAIMATRTLENQKDRITTMLITPLMSCGARLPIYAMIIPAFFPQKIHGFMLWLIYLIGIVLAIIAAKLLKSTILKGPTPPFVMELPPYRVPSLKSLVTHMTERAGLYIRKAGTIILGISIILWALTTYPKIDETTLSSDPDVAANQELAYSYAGRIGNALEPVLSPMGFDWKISTAFIGAFAAKEIFVAQMGIVFAVGEVDEESETLRQKLQANYNPLIGFCIMLFSLISAPCMATLAITKRESNSWKWALLQFGGLTVIAYLVTTLVYQVGSLAGIGI